MATVICYGYGGCGGIFSPTLFFGGMSGLVVAGAVNLVMPLPAADNLTLAVVGMSACLGAVVRAPVTGILIVFEMTHEFSLVPALMIGALISQGIARRMTRENFYDAILEQDGHKLEKLLPPRDLQTWQNLPVSAIANFQPVVLNSLEPAEVEKVLKANAFACFPVMQAEKLAGIATRAELTEAIAEKRAPKLAPIIRCEPRQTIRELQTKLHRIADRRGRRMRCRKRKIAWSGHAARFVARANQRRAKQPLSEPAFFFRFAPVPCSIFRRLATRFFKS